MAGTWPCWPQQRSYGIDQDGCTVLMDLERPLLPAKFRWTNFVMQWVVSRVPPTVESLVSAAQKAAGLSDFGDEEKFPFREGLAQLLVDVARDYPKMTAAGRMSLQMGIVDMLKNRLRIVDLVGRHPEILEEEVRDPVFIIGLPRSGTTHLHCALDQHDAFRTLKFQEMAETVLSRKEREAVFHGKEDPRLGRFSQIVDTFSTMRPFLPYMHEISVHRPEEDHQLMTCIFHCEKFADTMHCPNHIDWCHRLDGIASLEFLKLGMKVVQWQDLRMGKPRRRFLMKSGHHMAHLDALLKVFPNAKVIQTHRDPMGSLISLSTLTAYIWGLKYARLNLKATGKFCFKVIQGMLDGYMENRKLVAEQSFHVKLESYAKDNWGVLKAILKFLGEANDDAAMQTIKQFLEDNKRHKYGRIRQDETLFEFDMMDVQKKFFAYREHLKLL